MTKETSGTMPLMDMNADLKLIKKTMKSVAR